MSAEKQGQLETQPVGNIGERYERQKESETVSVQPDAGTTRGLPSPAGRGTGPLGGQAQVRACPGGQILSRTGKEQQQAICNENQRGGESPMAGVEVQTIGGLRVVSFTVPGNPVAKARARVFSQRGKVRAVTPEKTRHYEALAAWHSCEAMGGLPPMTGPVAVLLTLGMPIPAGWSKQRRQDAIDGKILPTKKPDTSNILKGLEDAMNKIVYKDDSQIVDHFIRKHYSLTPHARITVMEIDAMAAP